MKMVGHECVTKRITDITSVQYVFFKKNWKLSAVLNNSSSPTEWLEKMVIPSWLKWDMKPSMS